MEFSFKANMDYYPEFYAFNLVGDHNYRVSLMIIPRDVNHKTIDAQYQSTYDLIQKRLREIAERNDIDIEITKRELKNAIVDVMDGEYERLAVSKCAARLDNGNEPMVEIKAHSSVLDLEETTAEKNVVKKRTIKKKADKRHDVGGERE